MNCDTTALHIILVIAIINLAILYFYQSGWIKLPEKQNKKNTHLDDENGNNYIQTVDSNSEGVIFIGNSNGYIQSINLKRQ